MALAPEFHPATDAPACCSSPASGPTALGILYRRPPLRLRQRHPLLADADPRPRRPQLSSTSSASMCAPRDLGESVASHQVLQSLLADIWRDGTVEPDGQEICGRAWRELIAPQPDLVAIAVVDDRGTVLASVGQAAGHLQRHRRPGDLREVGHRPALVTSAPITLPEMFNRLVQPLVGGIYAQRIPNASASKLRCRTFARNGAQKYKPDSSHVLRAAKSTERQRWWCWYGRFVGA